MCVGGGCVSVCACECVCVWKGEGEGEGDCGVLCRMLVLRMRIFLEVRVMHVIT